MLMKILITVMSRLRVVWLSAIMYCCLWRFTTNNFQDSLLAHTVNAISIERMVKLPPVFQLQASLCSKTKGPAVRELQSLLFKKTGHGCCVDSSTKCGHQRAEVVCSSSYGSEGFGRKSHFDTHHF